MAAFIKLEPMDEDCLYLNVWSPDLEGKSPVMMWFHGGGFTAGSGSAPTYDGSNLAREGVVVVTINYRLHAFGFLYLDELFDEAEGTGNLGILDQIAALEWVQENIDAFGGDPGRVTIFGGSAGGMSVGTLLGTPKAKGLFHRAINQSGAAHHNLPSAEATRITRHLLGVLGIEAGDWEGLLNLPTERVVQTTGRIGAVPPGLLVELLGEHAAKKMALYPVIDGVTRDKMPIEAVSAGEAAEVDVLVGTNADEWRTYIYAVPDIGKAMPPTDVAAYFAHSRLSAEDVLSTYKQALSADDEVGLLSAVETDQMFGVPALRMADAQRRHHEGVWRYRFSWPTPLGGGVIGACHGLEVPFVFGNLDSSPLVGEHPPLGLSEAMRKTWATFAAVGDPNNSQLPEWPRHDPVTAPVMNFSENPQLIYKPDAERLELWEGVL